MAIDARALADFDGAWQLRKYIQHADGTIGTFSGTAAWVRQGDRATYYEVGQMTLTGTASFTAERRYLWSAGLEVSFEDGHFFHRVPPHGGPAAHWCEPDQYDGLYDFARWPDFLVTWRVKGPRKDYEMQCFYSRG